MKKTLKNHPYSQCHVVIHDNGDIDFVSYTTRVISLRTNQETGVLMVECTGTYSQTTGRQISWFLREYMPMLSYQRMKSIVGKGYVDV